MNQNATWTRRDARTELPSGAATLEFAWHGPDATPLRGDVVTVSASGIAFALDDHDAAIEEGDLPVPAIVRYRGLIVRGDLSVRDARPGGRGGGLEYGCLFYPSSLEDSARWMTLVTQRPENDLQSVASMSLRCATCHSTVWIDETGHSSHLCPECDQEYGFDKPHTTPMLEDLHTRARGLAIELGVDLPSAVSMLLGMLTLADVRDILNEPPPAAEPAASPASGRKRHIDPAFQPAIDAGTLTEAQAIQRGGREAFSRRLVARHRIRLDDAYDIADNRTSLLAILRKRQAREPIVAHYRPPSRRTRLVAVAVVALVALPAGIFLVRSFDREFNDPVAGTQTGRAAAVPAKPSRPASLPPTELSALPVDAYARVQSNERGEVLGVEATDPGNVLVAFCKAHDPSGGLDPVDVLPTDPPSDSSRLGLLRDLADGQAYRVVVIRRDPETRRWYLRNAGDPAAGISTFPAPERLISTARERL